MTRQKIRASEIATDVPCKNTRGVLAEMLAVCWLMRAGYHAFRNVAPHGPIDVVAVNPTSGETILIDVKKKGYSRYKDVAYVQDAPLPSPAQQAIGVRILVVDLATGECVWADETRRSDGRLAANRACAKDGGRVVVETTVDQLKAA